MLYKKQKAFTLIELLVVVAIIGVLASLVVISINSARAKSRDSKRMNDLKAFSKALDLYIDKNGHAPYLGALNCTAFPLNSLCYAVDTGENWNALETELSEYFQKLPSFTSFLLNYPFGG